MKNTYIENWEGSNSLIKDWVIPYLIKEYNLDLSPYFDVLIKTKWEGEHPGYKFDRVISRLKMSELLHTDEPFDQFSEAGGGMQTALRIYLISTTFDMLGQTNEFLTFKSWLNVNKKKGKYKHEAVQRTNKLNELLTRGIKSEDDLLNAIQEMHTDYLQNHGMGNAFQIFFSKILTQDDRNEILKFIWISNNKNAPNLSMNYISDKPEEWEKIGENDKIKKIAKTIENLCRNEYTHNGVQIYDFTDQDIIPPVSRKIESAILSGNLQVQTYYPNNTADFKKLIDIIAEMRYNNHHLKLSQNNTLHILSKEKVDIELFCKEFVSFNLKVNGIIRGGDIYFDNMKKVLSYKGISLTKLLFKIAMKGLAEKIILTVKKTKS